MTSSEHGWQEVADNFTALGRRLRERVKEGGADQGTEEEQAEVGNALKQFAEAAERLGERLNAAVKDDEVRHGAQQAVRSLGDAVKGTFTEVSGEVKERLARARGGEGGAGDAAATTDQPATGPAALPSTPPPSDPVVGEGDSTTTDGTP